MVLFFTENIQKNKAVFEGDELKHIQQSLRKKTGESIHFIDGKGTFYEGEIAESSKKSIIVNITSSRKDKNDFPYLHVAIAPTKNIDRIEWFVEKSVEMGISEISFILCKHSERKIIKMPRMERIVIAAAKQSMKAFIPKLNELDSYENWLAKSNTEQSFIASLHEDSKAITKAYKFNLPTSICIGPEGGFRRTEVDQAIVIGFQPVSLGNQRLRTETAGIKAVATIHVMHESNSFK